MSRLTKKLVAPLLALDALSCAKGHAPAPLATSSTTVAKVPSTPSEVNDGAVVA